MIRRTGLSLIFSMLFTAAFPQVITPDNPTNPRVIEKNGVFDTIQGGVYSDGEVSDTLHVKGGFKFQNGNYLNGTSLGPVGANKCIQFNSSGGFGASNNFNYDGTNGVFYLFDTNGDTLFSVNTATREIRAWGPVYFPRQADSSVAIIGDGGALQTDSNSFSWKGNGLYLLNRANASTSLGALVITGGSSQGQGAVVQTLTNNVGNNGPLYSFKRAKGSLSSPSAPALGNELGVLDFGGWDGSQWVGLSGSIKAKVSSSWIGGSVPCFFEVNTRDASGTFNSCIFTSKGGFSVKGTNADTLFDFNVHGHSYLTGNLTVGGICSADVFVSTNGYIQNGAGRWVAPFDGTFTFTNNAQNGFNYLQFGGSTSAFPAIHRQGSVLRLRLADTSGYAGLQTGTLSVNGVPDASAAVTVNSTTQGFLPPVMTAAQASAISSPAFGLIVVVNNTNGTFTSTGCWIHMGGGTWNKL